MIVGTYSKNIHCPKNSPNCIYKLCHIKVFLIHYYNFFRPRTLKIAYSSSTVITNQASNLFIGSCLFLLVKNNC